MKLVVFLFYAFFIQIATSKLTSITYFLCTSSNPQDCQLINRTNSQTLQNSTFDSNATTLLYSHGYNGGINDKYVPKIKKAMQDRGIAYNLIIQDWSVLGENPNYFVAKEGVEPAGKDLALFIEFLQSNLSLSLSKLILSGHSLGAHVAGYCGKNMPAGSRIQHIIGLDPAGVFYTDPNKMLNSSDAKYVETIQTNGNAYGYYMPIGSASFYPNGGVTQPGCDIWNLIRCSHDRSVEYFVEALRNNLFFAKKCKDMGALSIKTCDVPLDAVKMGDLNNGQFELPPKGIFYLETNGNSPYGKGEV
ncbi:hypothetical protein ACFFRR_005984 [Megaselia abdita]